MTFVPENLAELWLISPGFDDLLLTGDSVDDDGHAFTIDALDEEASWGDPSPIDVAVQRWMADGAVASTQGYENRDLTFKVAVEAGNARDLAAGEGALARRAGKPALLKWIPPSGDGDAPASVFEVWTWHLAQSFDSLDERNLCRIYTVQAVAKPWVRSADLTVVDALSSDPGAPTTVSIDTCASTTGWTGMPNTPTTSGGALKESGTVTVSGSPVSTSRSLNRSGAVSGMLTTPYLVIDETVTGGTVSGWIVTVDGQSTTPVATIGTQHYYLMPAGVDSFTMLNIGALVTVSHTGTVVLSVADVTRTDTIGGIGSRKQLSQTLDVGGSVPTAGSIQIASPSATTLGNVLVYTRVDDGSAYVPAMRGYRTSGNTTTVDATAVSGVHEALVNAGTPAGTITYTIPANSLREGTYAVVGRFNPSTTTPIAVTVTANVPGTFVTDTITRSAAGFASAWNWMVLGSLNLPTTPVPPESAANLVVTLQATHTATVTLDELYLLDLTHGAVSLLGVGGSTRLWIDAADANPATNRPALYVGTLDDRSDAVALTGSMLTVLGDHDFDPAGMSVFTVTDNVDNAVVTASFYRRWHTNAGE